MKMPPHRGAETEKTKSPKQRAVGEDPVGHVL
jgi:hypothetical protein